MLAVQPHPVDYVILRNVISAGPVIGQYAGTDIVSEIKDEYGRAYVYAGVALRKWNGKFDTACLAAGEFILEPGLIYRLINMPKSYVKKFYGWPLAR